MYTTPDCKKFISVLKMLFWVNLIRKMPYATEKFIKLTFIIAKPHRKVIY